MTLQASLPCSAVNVPDDFFYMAGFEVTLYGRIWVSTEVERLQFRLIWAASIRVFILLLLALAIWSVGPNPLWFVILIIAYIILEGASIYTKLRTIEKEKVWIVLETPDELLYHEGSVLKYLKERIKESLED